MTIAKLVDLGQKAFNAFTQGITGEEFASSVYMLEPELYQMLAGMGKDQMLTVLQAQPAIWAQVAPRAAEVEQFLDAFIAYGQEPAAENEPEQPAGGAS